MSNYVQSALITGGLVTTVNVVRGLYFNNDINIIDIIPIIKLSIKKGFFLGLFWPLTAVYGIKEGIEYSYDRLTLGSGSIFNPKIR